MNAIDNRPYREKIKQDFYAAVDQGVSATPTVIIGEEKLVGVKDADTYRYFINVALDQKGIASPVGPVAKPVGKQAEPVKVPKDMIFQVNVLKPNDSKPFLKVGDKAPDFALPTLDGKTVKLSDFKGKQNVVLSFVPAAWTPVCSEQWPEYNRNKELFEKYDTVLIGITVDNIPALFSWTHTMGDLWFTVASDFYPHGKVTDSYGILRSSGTSERAVFVINKGGIIKYIDIHDINSRPDLLELKAELEKLR